MSNIFQLKSPAGATPIIIGTVITTLAVVASRFAFRGKKIKIIKSPAATLLPRLTQAEKDALPYPPDAFPGGRDVESPYGSMKVYEWGPDNGRKVLLVHGITSCSLALGAVAHGLVEKGCRVMLLDLWGRGYSDTCADLDHDDRLYSTQILLAITSSALPWTGKSGFSLIGYSLGGGISASFASYFPNMVESLVLIAPAGLIRPSRLVSQDRAIFFLSLLPKSIQEMLLRYRLQRPMFPKENNAQGNTETVSETLAEAQTETENPKPDVPPASLAYPNITLISAIQWHIRVHAGLITSFMSSVQHAPTINQHELWKRFRLRDDKILIFCASDDPIINAREFEEDATAVLGAEKLEFRLINGAHDIPTTHPNEIVKGIWEYWKI